jgi:uroporphyrin-III C-methyltransferase/precorrin-2 dehydrogenase/sirohydrochlorin ferrochelatase
VADDGHAHGALVNIVDVMEGSDFYTGGVVRRGPLTISIGTSGNSPALARRVRMLVDEALPAGLSPLAQALGEARPRLLARHPDFKARAALLDAFVAASIARLTTTTTPEDVHAWIERELLTGDA